MRNSADIKQISRPLDRGRLLRRVLDICTTRIYTLMTETGFYPEGSHMVPAVRAERTRRGRRAYIQELG